MTWSGSLSRRGRYGRPSRWSTGKNRLKPPPRWTAASAARSTLVGFASAPDVATLHGDDWEPVQECLPVEREQLAGRPYGRRGGLLEPFGVVGLEGESQNLKVD